MRATTHVEGKAIRSSRGTRGRRLLVEDEHGGPGRTPMGPKDGDSGSTSTAPAARASRLPLRGPMRSALRLARAVSPRPDLVQGERLERRSERSATRRLRVRRPWRETPHSRSAHPRFADARGGPGELRAEDAPGPMKRPADPSRSKAQHRGCARARSTTPAAGRPSTARADAWHRPDRSWGASFAPAERRSPPARRRARGRRSLAAPRPRTASPSSPPTPPRAAGRQTGPGTAAHRRGRARAHATGRSRPSRCRPTRP